MKEWLYFLVFLVLLVSVCSFVGFRLGEKQELKRLIPLFIEANAKTWGDGFNDGVANCELKNSIQQGSSL